MREEKTIKIINEIEKIRVKNNRLWMDILRLALVSQPKKTQKILKSINNNDSKIHEALGKIK